MKRVGGYLKEGIGFTYAQLKDKKWDFLEEDGERQERNNISPSLFEEETVEGFNKKLIKEASQTRFKSGEKNSRGMIKRDKYILFSSYVSCLNNCCWGKPLYVVW